MIIKDPELIRLIRSKYPSDFGNLFVEKAKNKKSQNQKQNGSVVLVEEDLIIMQKAYPKMTHINQVLGHPDVKGKIWASLGLDASIELPRFPNDVLYGRLSEQLHFPKFRSVLLSDKEDSKYKDFFIGVVTKYDLLIEEYSEVEAAAGEAALGDTVNDDRKR